MAKVVSIMGTDEHELVGVNNDTGAPYKVLIVDDSIFIAKQLAQILSSEGFEVIDTAENGRIAVEKYQNYYPNVDLVTLDITMPEMDGITALGKLLEFDKKVRVVMVSALGSPDVVKQSLLMGAKNYIIKPLNREKVLERIGGLFPNASK